MNSFDLDFNFLFSRTEAAPDDLSSTTETRPDETPSPPPLSVVPPMATVAPPDQDTTPAPTFKITRYTNTRGNLTKTLHLNTEGVLEKLKADPLYEGMAEVLTLTSLKELQEVHCQLDKHQALGYGIFDDTKSSIMPLSTLKHQQAFGDAAVARSSQYFTFPFNIGGVVMLDFDPLPDASVDLFNLPVVNEDNILDLLFEIEPALKSAPLLLKPSASSFVFNTATQQWVSACRGYRVYILISNAADIPRAGKALFTRCYLKFGAAVLRNSIYPAPLHRTLIDGAVFQSERLDYCSGAVVEAPLTQDIQGRIRLVNEDQPFFDSRQIKDLTRAENDQWVMAKQRNAAKIQPDQVQRSQELRIETKAYLETTQRGSNTDVEMTLTRILERGELQGYFQLKTSEGHWVTVNDILNDKKRYHNSRFCDPLEPDYRDDHRIAIANLYAPTPYLYSHAHGGRKYDLYRQTLTLTINSGNMLEMVKDTVNFINTVGELFEVKNGHKRYLVEVREGHCVEMERDHLYKYIGNNINFETLKVDKTSDKVQVIPKNCPSRLVDLVMSDMDKNLPLIKGVITAPLMTTDFELLVDEGFDAKTQLFFYRQPTDPPITIPEFTLETMETAFAELFTPIQNFPYKTDLDRSVAMAALWVAVVRPVLRTCPGFIIAAPKPATGKTKLAQCFAKIMGESGSITPMSSDTAELKKLITSMVVERARAIILDNLESGSAFNNDALCAAITSGFYRDRILGESRSVEAPFDATVFLTGNHIRTAADSDRRFLAIELDSGMANPESRQFAFEPVRFAEQSRMKIVEIILGLLKLYAQETHHGETFTVKEHYGSFEDFDLLVRKPLLWFAKVCPALKLEDVLLSVKRNQDNDDQNGVLIRFLSAWYQQFNSKSITAKALLQYYKETPEDNEPDDSDPVDEEIKPNVFGTNSWDLDREPRKQAREKDRQERRAFCDALIEFITLNDKEYKDTVQFKLELGHLLKKRLDCPVRTVDDKGHEVTYTLKSQLLRKVNHFYLQIGIGS